MRIHRNPKKQHQHLFDRRLFGRPTSEPAGVGDTPHPAEQPTAPLVVTKRKTHPSFFQGLDTAAAVFLGPADRTDGDTPVVHAHDAAEDTSDETLRSVDIYTDSFGHHYAQRKPRVERRAP
ncbi:hypothetical protein ACX80I_07305 [Arthrobacter sp. MDT3-44]